MNPNQLSIKIGRTLINSGLKFVQQGFQLSPKEATREELATLIANKLNCESGFMDGKFYLVSIDDWRNFNEFDWTKEKIYVTDKFDCDNYAFTFAAHISELFDITVGTCYGKVYNKDTGKYIDLHYWNVVITKELDGLHLYFYEPMNGGFAEVIDKSRIVIGNMRYEPIKLTLF
jgi:hypothetical protein